MHMVRSFQGRLVPADRSVSEKERVQGLFERAANFRTLARDILGMADELESEAMCLVGSSGESDIVKSDHGSHSSRFEEVARSQYRARRVRERYFDKKIFGEPAWDMLLELYASELKDEKISTSNLILSSSSPSSTALRWIKNLEDNGMVVKKSSLIDGRVQYQKITSTGFESMTKYFESISTKK